MPDVQQDPLSPLYERRQRKRTRRTGAVHHARPVFGLETKKGVIVTCPATYNGIGGNAKFNLRQAASIRFNRLIQIRERNIT
jgi:hypothetical protein